jgi:hypothetical protein
MGIENAAEREDDWRLLAGEEVAAGLGPTQLLRAVVQRVNAMVAETAAELDSIDSETKAAEVDTRTAEDETRLAENKNNELYTKDVDEAKKISAWLTALGSPIHFNGTQTPPQKGKLPLGDDIQHLAAAGERSWHLHYSDKPKLLDAKFGKYLLITGADAFLFLISWSASPGLGPFKMLLGAVAAVMILIIILNRDELSNFRNSIVSSNEETEKTRAILQNNIAAYLNDLERKWRSSEVNLRRVLSERLLGISGRRVALVEREDGLRARYAREIHCAKSAFQRVWQASGLYGKSIDDEFVSLWSLPESAVSYLRIGEISPPTLDLDLRLMPSESLARLPLLAPFAPGLSLCFVSGVELKSQVLGSMQDVTLRIVAAIPPGKLRFVFIDPIGLGRNVAPLLALGDHAEQLIGGRSWSEPSHIEQRLGEITQHMETVIQKYLRDDFKTIEAYNAQAGQIVEAYRIVVIYDFPTNFTEAAARRLTSIAENGPRCGVYTVMSVDAEKPMPYGVGLKPITSHMNRVFDRHDAPVFSDPDFENWSLTLDVAPSAAVAQHIVRAHGERAEAGMRVSAPFGDLVQFVGLDKVGWNDGPLSSSADDLIAALGPSGSHKYQELIFGRGTAHHALVVGQTGSGKSNLLHVLITTLALRYAPDELELYLIDFKQGVEFKLYADAQLPHAKVIAIQSEREFGLSVLRGLLAEMGQRGELFRAAGVPGLADWQIRTRKKLPRILLLVDEFRVFFTADDSVSSEATMILDRLVSQGRAFGIHVILASQTLAGGYALPRSITDQMGVRIVLQCTDADSRAALADDNSEARLLTRPGEAIYNDQRGLIEGNHRFQVSDIGNDDVRQSTLSEYLKLRLAAWHGQRRRPIVFEGHQPARLEDCAPLLAALGADTWPPPPRFVDIWVGEPIALRPPTSVRFLRQSGANVLIVMRDEGQAIALAQAAVLALAAQLSPLVAGFHIVDMSSVDGPWAGTLGQLTDSLPHRARITGRRGLSETLETIGRELERRLQSGPPAESIFLLLIGLQRMRDLREDDVSDSLTKGVEQLDLRRTFATILREGPEVGIHSLIWVDSQSAASRVLDRRMIADCGRRIVGPMSEQDSLAIIDEPTAGRLDRPHRLVRFDDDRPGDLETFRPFVVSTAGWMNAAGQQLADRKKIDRPAHGVEG